MAKLSELRERSKITRELQEQKMKRVRDTVVDVVNSSSFELTALEHMSQEQTDSFATTVASKVAEVVLDPVIEFTDACTARGLKPSQIRSAVKVVNSAFGLCESEDYDEQKKAVAEYMQEHPDMYDKLAPLNT